MDFVRTPDTRFKQLLDYPFEPNYVDLDNLRMHYVDEGPANASPILMLHGEPSWSYLYRHMIPVCAAAGHRVIAPDLIGFGKSDKPTSIEDYSYQTHMEWMQQFIDKLDLNNITLVCQDWGSLLGLRLAAENPERFRAIVVGNGMLPTCVQYLEKLCATQPLVPHWPNHQRRLIPQTGSGRTAGIRRPLPEQKTQGWRPCISSPRTSALRRPGERSQPQSLDRP